MVNLSFKPAKYLIAFLLFLLGYAGAIFLDFNFNWLSMITTGLVSLVILYGYSNLKIFFRPFDWHKWRMLVWYLFLLFILEIIPILIVVFFFPNVIKSLRGTSIISESYQLHTPLILRIWVTFKILVSIVGEEVGMASISIPLIHLLLKTKMKKFAWPIVNSLGCLLLALLHLPHYHFELFMPLVVGITRYPITASWKKSNTLWSGIYIHWISDIVVIISALI
ncbi:bacteriocin immunity protein [Fructilactobacillus hinvesii]|uniref:Bacteriocin immunity protein n=1 Tax=Fructilactobacillus hinvesii TaxID=2940300 RepID=A0ABY5BV87_9LACO|nr:bacteriocin immunity protein [Fructilactobacillus hinvesii]USS88368.1 bacteriocin immunity protein [Fructilactobacillus hinvesii]